jgi:hypothetical protein
MLQNKRYGSAKSLERITYPVTLRLQISGIAKVYILFKLPTFTENDMALQYLEAESSTGRKTEE